MKISIKDASRKTGVFFALLAGLTISTALVAYHSFAAVGGAVWRIGWGLGVIVAIHFVAIVFCGVAWRVLFNPEWSVPVRLLITLRWIRESVNTLLPVARVGGDIVGIRLLVLRGINVSLASAGIVADSPVNQITPESCLFKRFLSFFVT